MNDAHALLMFFLGLLAGALAFYLWYKMSNRAATLAAPGSPVTI